MDSSMNNNSGNNNNSNNGNTTTTIITKSSTPISLSETPDNAINSNSSSNSGNSITINSININDINTNNINNGINDSTSTSNTASSRGDNDTLMSANLFSTQFHSPIINPTTPPAGTTQGSERYSNPMYNRTSFQAIPSNTFNPRSEPFLTRPSQSYATMTSFHVTSHQDNNDVTTDVIDTNVSIRSSSQNAPNNNNNNNGNGNGIAFQSLFQSDSGDNGDPPFDTMIDLFPDDGINGQNPYQQQQQHQQHQSHQQQQHQQQQQQWYHINQSHQQQQQHQFLYNQQPQSQSQSITSGPSQQQQPQQQSTSYTFQSTFSNQSQFQFQQQQQQQQQQMGGMPLSHEEQCDIAARTLFVTNIPRRVMERDIVGLFEQCGGYVSARMRRTKNDKYIAFIEFETPETAAVAKERFDGYAFEGGSGKGGAANARISIEFSSPSHPPSATGEVVFDERYTPNSILYVEGVPPDASKREVAHIFRHFNGYQKLRLFLKKDVFTGKDFYLCFVDFATVEDATFALRTLQGYKMDLEFPDDRGLTIYYAKNKKSYSSKHF